MSDEDRNAPFPLGDGAIIRETEKAVLASIDGQHVWIPKSCLHDDSEAWSMKNSRGLIVVVMWWAEKTGYV